MQLFDRWRGRDGRVRNRFGMPEVVPVSVLLHGTLLEHMASAPMKDQRIPLCSIRLLKRLLHRPSIRCRPAPHGRGGWVKRRRRLHRFLLRAALLTLTTARLGVLSGLCGSCSTRCATLLPSAETSRWRPSVSGASGSGSRSRYRPSRPSTASDVAARWPPVETRQLVKGLRRLPVNVLAGHRLQPLLQQIRVLLCRASPHRVLRIQVAALRLRGSPASTRATRI